VKFAPPIQRKPRHQRGFTLLEVIVAVVIAALCLSALSQVFATGVRAASTSSDYMRAMTLAQSLLAGVGIEKPAADGSDSGTSSDGRLNWTLTVATEPTDEAENPIRPPLELKRVSARVVAVDPGNALDTRGRTVELITLVAVPRAAP
jgi:general secretion pathway protein I